MPIPWQFILTVLGWILQWFLSRKPKTPRQKRLSNHLLLRLDSIRTAAAADGFNPAGDPEPSGFDPEQEAKEETHHTLTGE